MKDINKLHPDIQEKCLQFVAKCKAAGIDVIITQTLRTKADQDAIYAQGRTKSGKIVTKCKYPMSPHCWGVAFDFAVVVDGKVNWARADLYKKSGEIGKSLGLFWGGDFQSFPDMPHLEDPTFVVGKSVQSLIKKYSTPEKFIASWPDMKGDDDVEKVSVVVGGKQVDGFIKDGVSYLPARSLEIVGLKIKWDGVKKLVEVSK